MFHRCPCDSRFPAIIVLVILSGSVSSAQQLPQIPLQPGPRFANPRGQNVIIFRDGVPSRETPSKMLAPIVPPPPPMPTRVPINPARLDTLVSDLQSGDFRERVKATRELKERGGASTVDRMREAVFSDSPEVSMRALAVLEAIFLSSDQEANRAAESTLELLMLDRYDNLALQARHILESHRSVRNRRAVSDLVSLGLEFEYSADFYDEDDDTGELIPAIAHVRLTRDWKGGEEGLLKLTRLSNLPTIYVIGRSPVSAERTAEILLPLIPNVRIEQRSAAQLGIQASTEPLGPNERGVKIMMVTPGKAAQLAGIRANDLITHVEGLETPTFNVLVKRLEKFQPGDVIEVIVGRESQLQDARVLDVELKGW